jgi:hypothetical protein
MALRAQAIEDTTSGEAAPAKRKRTRSASVAKPAFFVLQMLNEEGEPVAFDKSRLKLVLVERNAEKIMEIMDNSTYPYAFYLRGIVPVQRQSAPRMAATDTPPVAA